MANVNGGSFSCSGCNAILALKWIIETLGKDTIIVNSSGCMTLEVTYPFTPINVPWVHGAIENAAAIASGISSGLDIQKKKANIVCFAGDGATYDIGLQSMSGALERGDDIIYFCYDNEAYGNTGFQKSGATPRGSVTTTTPAGSKIPTGHIGHKKDLYEIAKAHKPAYVATVNIAYPTDFMKKVAKAAKNTPSVLIGLTPCPTGWGFDPSKTIALGREAVETGMWVLKEYENGEERITVKPKERKPVENYLKSQKRFRHLFKPVHQTQEIEKIQKQEVSQYHIVEPLQ